MPSPSTIEIINKSQSEFNINNHNIKNVSFKLLKNFEDSFDRKFSRLNKVFVYYNIIINCR